MKKNVVFMLIVFVIICVISMCKGEESFGSHETTAMTIYKLNENSNMYFELYQEADVRQEWLQQIYTPDVPYYMQNKDGTVEARCYKYPTEESDIKVTDIRITGNKYNVYGINVGYNLQNAITILHEYKYEDVEYTDGKWAKLANGDVYIVLRCEENIIYEIGVFLYNEEQKDDGEVY